MSTDIRNLEPKQLWNNFADLNAIPRGSKKEEKIVQFMVDFGKKLGLETVTDAVDNVIIKKPATKGMENRKGIVLQSHLDMVHQKNADTDFNFDTDGIKMLIDDGWVKADGTTLGADNGIGVVSIMAILQATDIPHPAIDALFTIDEETGMTGAMGLQAGYLDGEILLNLDTEEDDEIDIGCAGGVDVTATKKYTEIATPSNSIAYNITVNGLSGGHSGMDIDKGLGNANKIMNRLFFETQNFISIANINGGGLRNAIPRESFATVVVLEKDKEAFLNAVSDFSKTIKNEYKTVEPNLEVTSETTEVSSKIMAKEDQSLLIKAIYAAHNGVYKMSPDMEGLVETSNNVAKIIVKDGEISVSCLTRSADEVSKLDLANTLKAVFELAGFNVDFSGSYPGWKPNPNSAILTTMTEIYNDMFGEKPAVVACHAGLECGILGTNYPEMDMISFGPTIKGAHSPDERVNIKSVQKYWSYLLRILENIPVK